MTPNEKPTGPASYFPSIEKKYGQPIGHWLDLVRQRTGMTHMEIVNHLKAEHGMGHGHANAVVGYVLAESTAPGGTRPKGSKPGT
jgi:hypothetical protein